MRRRLFTVLSILTAAALTGAVLICVFTMRSVYATEDPHTHCLCGREASYWEGEGLNSVSHACSAVAFTGVESEDEIFALDGIGEAPSEARTYRIYLKKDITLTKMIDVYANVNLTICLNGKTLTGASNTRVLRADSKANVTINICDCSAEKSGKILPQGESSKAGHAIYVSGSTTVLNIYGGTIQGGSVKGAHGGNVFAEAGGTINIYGGTLSGGHAEVVESSGGIGGNVAVSTDSKLRIYGGLITDGWSTNAGGNVGGVNNNTNILIAGGTIENGTCDLTGGNVGIVCYGNASITSERKHYLTITGGTIRKGQGANGGNIGLQATVASAQNTYGSSSIVKISGGRFENGVATTGMGGNLGQVGTNKAIMAGTSIEISGGTFTGGEAATYGGNIGLQFYGTLTVKGDALIEKGKARIGGNIYFRDKMFMAGGTVREGEAYVAGTSGGFGGNIASYGVLTLSGGEVKDGYCDYNKGGNIAVWTAGGQLIMSGGRVTGGVAARYESSGGIAVFSEATKQDTFILSGGEISGNTGGIVVETGNLVLSGSPVITNNGNGLNTGFTVKASAISIGEGGYSGSVLTLSAGIGDEILPSETDETAYFTLLNGNFMLSYDEGKQVHIVGVPASVVEANRNKTIDIYMIAGQSNASGSTSIESAKEGGRDLNVYENVLYYDYRVSTSGTLRVDHRDFTGVREGYGYDSTHIGPELGMARILNPLYADDDKTALILKYAAGGTSILFRQKDDGTPLQSLTEESLQRFLDRGSWYPDVLQSEAVKALGENRPTGYLARNFGVQVENCYADLIKLGYQPENIHFKSINWMQGESDRSTPAAYKEVFPVLIEELRGYISEATGQDYSDLPIVIGEICETFSTLSNSSVATNRSFIAMQHTLNEVVTNVTVIPSGEFEMIALKDGEEVYVGTDNGHWNYADAVAIGEMFAHASLGETVGRPVRTMCICGGGFDGVGTHTCSLVSWTPVLLADDLQQNPGFSSSSSSKPTVNAEYYFYLKSDVTLTQGLSLNPGVKLHIDLNGYNLIAKTSTRLIHNVYGDKNNLVTISDSSEAKTGQMTAVGTYGSSANTLQGHVILLNVSGSKLEFFGGTVTGGHTKNNYGGHFALASGTTFNMYGGTLDGGISESMDASKDSTRARGGNLYSAGTVNLYGGVIKNGQAMYSGGNVCVTSSGTLNMYEGAVITNDENFPEGTANASAGSVAILCTFNMYGGEISNGRSAAGRTLTSGQGGNLCIFDAGTFNMYGGVIKDGKASSWGGNVCVRSGAAIYMEGGTISGGEAISGFGGNVAFPATNGKPSSFSGGTVEGGIAKTYGGNIGVYSGTDLTISGTAVIKDGYAAEKGGNIAFTDAEYGTSAAPAAPTLLLNGGTIQGGSTALTIPEGSSIRIGGGNISMANRANLTMTDGIVSGGQSRLGGNIYIATSSRGNFEFTGGTIKDGHTEANGWEIQNESANGASVHIGGNVLISNSLSQSGGGSVNTAYKADTLIDGGTILSSVFITSGNVTITGGCFGGALTIYNAENGFFHVSGGRFVNKPAFSRMVNGYYAFEEEEIINGVTYAYAVYPGFTVTVNSVTTGGQAAVSALSGGGIYRSGETVTITAENNGQHFLGWWKNSYQEGTLPVSTSLIYETAPVGNETYAAVYEYASNSFTYTVKASSFTVSVNGSEPVFYTGTSGALTAQPGSIITLSYTGEGSFHGWQNENGKTLALGGNAYEFDLVRDLIIEAGETAPGAESARVIFMNDSAQVLSAVSVDPADPAFVYPAVPARIGYTVSWNKTEKEVLSAIENGARYVEVKAVLTEKEAETMSVTIQTVVDGIEKEATVISVKPGVRVVLNAPEVEGASFACFELRSGENRTVLAYTAVIGAFFSQNTTVYAVYVPTETVVEKAPVITLSVVSEAVSGGVSAKFTALRDLPDDCILVEHGLLYAPGVLNEEEMVYGATGVRTARSSATGHLGTCSLNVSLIPDGYALTARGYMIYRTSEGMLKYLYSDAITVSAPQNE